MIRVSSNHGVPSLATSLSLSLSLLSILVFAKDPSVDVRFVKGIERIGRPVICCRQRRQARFNGRSLRTVSFLMLEMPS